MVDFFLCTLNEARASSRDLTNGPSVVNPLLIVAFFVESLVPNIIKNVYSSEDLC